MGQGPAKAAALGMPAISAARGTKDYKRQIGERGLWLDDQFKYRGATLDSLGIKDEEGQGKGIWRTYGPGGFNSMYGSGVSTNFLYDWASGRKLNIATNVGSQTPESRQNSNGQWVFNPETADPSRWEPITPEEYQGYQEQTQWNSQNPNMTYADRLAQMGMQEGVRAGHWTLDPKSGNYYNFRGNNPNDVEWKDQFGRPIGGASGGSYRPGPGGAAPGGRAPGGMSSMSFGGGVQGGPSGWSGPAYRPSTYYGEDGGFQSGPGPFGGGGMGGMYPGMGGGSYTPTNAAEAALMTEAAKQARLDTLQNQFMYERAAREYAGGMGPEQFSLDLAGQVMGVEFPQSDYSLTNYFNQGMGTPYSGVNIPGSSGGWPNGLPPGYPPNAIPGSASGSMFGNPGVIPPHPSTAPPKPLGGGSSQGGGGMFGNPQTLPVTPAPGPPKPLSNPAPGGAKGLSAIGNGPSTPDLGAKAIPPFGPGGSPEGGVGPELPPYGEPGGPNYPFEGVPGFLGNGTTLSPEEENNLFPGVNQAAYGAPGYMMNNYGPGGGMSGMYPALGQPGGLPSVPFPSFPQSSGYKPLSGPGFDAAQRKTWGLLAGPATGIADEGEAEIERLRRDLPEGGERDRAIADALRGVHRGVGELRQGLVDRSLGTIQNIGTQRKYGVPMGALTGGAGTGLSYLGNQYATNMGAASSRYASDRQYQGLVLQGQAQRDAARQNSLGAAFGAIGAMGAAGIAL